jgi:streptogramin lyase
MKRLLVTAVVLFTARLLATAHPGIGLVQDSRGTLFFTDLVHVWKVEPNGRKTIAVPNVHTHELGLDAEDNLYGEDSQYEGAVRNRWHHRIWKRSLDGRVTDLFGTRPGFRQDYGFARDRRGTQYWLEHEPAAVRIRRRSADGTVTTIQPKTALPRLSWLAVSADGSALYLTSSHGVYRLAHNGTVTPLLEHARTTPHALMGLWPAPDGSVYVADYAAQTLIRVELNGNVTVVARTEGSWSPSSVLRGREGALWILEYSSSNEARLRRVDAAGRSQVF